MADHVAVGVVAHDEIKAVLFDGVHQNVRDRFRFIYILIIDIAIIKVVSDGIGCIENSF